MGRRPGKGGRDAPGGKTKQEQLRQLISDLEARIEQEGPPPGTNPLAEELPSGDPDQPIMRAPKRFEQLPLSPPTMQGLEKAGYKEMKEIQRACIPHILAGRDVLGAAKTGSGKTLAFLVPMVEKLFRLYWSSVDGLGGLVISPTRELAIQIFEVLRKIGARHDISAGLIIGGKDVASEQERILNMNILVCTPGRLLQHMDETYGFDASNLQMLVLDEADRILDMGFSATLNNIVQNLPPKRQTLLFSATLTKSVRDLARLSLSRPEYLAVHEKATYQTPTKLQQHYMVVDSTEKLDVLWSFIKTHLHSKIMVFLSSCNQVRFVHAAFARLRPGMVINALHGKIKQEKRYQIFNDFCERKEALLFATDVAGRGLDFPAVDWVVQADCPEDTAAYVHRVGRTARNDTKGKALLLLTPAEVKMAHLLHDARVPLKKIQANKSKLQPLVHKLSQQLSADPDLKHMAQKALVSYMRSVHLQPNKEVFDVQSLPAEALATAWGLPTAPRLRFVTAPAVKTKNVPYAMREEHLEGVAKQREQAASGKGEAAAEEEEGAGEGAGEVQRQRVTSQPKSKMTKLLKRTNQDVLSAKYRRLVEDDAEGGGEGSDEELFTVASRQRHEEGGEGEEGEEGAPGEVGREEVERKRISKRSMKKIRVNSGHGNRVVFDEEGEALSGMQALGAGREEEEEVTPAEHAQRLKATMAQRDVEDRETFRRRQKEAKLKLKVKLKKMEGAEDDEDEGEGEDAAEGGKPGRRRRGEEEEEEKEVASVEEGRKKRGRREQAAKRRGDSSSEEEEGARRGMKGRGGGGKSRREEVEECSDAGEHEEGTLEDQEKDALALLLKRRKVQ